MSNRGKTTSKLVSALAAVGLLVAVAAVLMLNTAPVKAGTEMVNVPCDFLTGGGFITPTSNGAHANFGVGGSCRPGGDGHGLWGHLEFIDHGSGLEVDGIVPFNVHWLTITGYFHDFLLNQPDGGTAHQPTGARIICGTARTNDPLHPSVNFGVRANDQGEPGTSDQFDIQVTDQMTNAVVYTTAAGFPHTLAGGNIQLHAHNPAITGTFGGSCPALGVM